MFSKMVGLAQINNLEIKKYLCLILATSLALVMLVGLSSMGYDVIGVRQITGFIFLTSVPGLLILRILKLHQIGNIETLLYSVGLSLAFVMFIGSFMNTLYPFVGISKPISTFPLIVTLTIAVAILCTIAYKQESQASLSYPRHPSVQWTEILSPQALILFLLPILAVLGTYLVNSHQSNIPLLILLPFITLIVALVTFGKFIPTKLYPLAVVAIAIALLWHWSLTSWDLTGYDINHEYYIQSLVLDSSVWDSTIVSNVNAMLSIVMLAPIYSLMLNLDTVWVFKIIYPIFYSLVPLALFQAYRKQTDDKLAFLAAFFFMSMPAFFSSMPTHAREEIAHLFFALSILLFVDKGMAVSKRAVLLIIFGLSIVVSHYGLSYFYIFYLVMTWSLLFLCRSDTVRELWQGEVARFGKLRHRVDTISPTLKPSKASLQRSTLSGTYTMLFIVFCLAWYMYVSSGSSINAVVRIGDHIYTVLDTEMFSLTARNSAILQAVGLAPMRGGEIEWEIARIFQYVTQFFIMVGILGLFANRCKTRFHPEYTTMSIVSLVILAMCIILPYFASYISIIRIYHITLFFLAPFCIIGGVTVFHWLSRMLSLCSLNSLTSSAHLRFVVILVLVPYFLFSTGFIFHLTGATPSSMPLSLYETDWSFFTKSEVFAREWLVNVGSNHIVYSDSHGRTQMHQKFSGSSLIIPFDPKQMRQDSYIFLRRWNIVHDELLLYRPVGAQFIWEYIDLKSGSEFQNALGDRNKIYDCGWAQIIRPRQGEW